MLQRLNGKVIIVAGAGGIGNELARRFAREGAAVVLGDIDAAMAADVAAQVTAEGGIARGIALDGADEAAIAAAVALAVSEFGGLDGFHANFASFADGMSTADVTTMAMADWDEGMRVNARGAVLCARHAVPALVARGGGSMVWTGSGAVYVGEEMRVGYAMAKASLGALMRHVARTFGPRGVRANVVAPGVIAHPRFAEVIPEDIQQGFREATLLKSRLGRPEDIAAMAALLMADEGSYITGQVLSVDGGNTLRP
ncbi:MAG: SDR family oxidoreductase [Sphingomonadales bacterium]|nr:SDR family oxidoreductase [Sphingomonadales bacterium]